jgi:hypothetical protein
MQIQNGESAFLSYSQGTQNFLGPGPTLWRWSHKAFCILESLEKRFKCLSVWVSPQSFLCSWSGIQYFNKITYEILTNRGWGLQYFCLKLSPDWFIFLALTCYSNCLQIYLSKTTSWIDCSLVKIIGDSWCFPGVKITLHLPTLWYCSSLLF